MKPHQERMTKEYIELYDRRSKLGQFITDYYQDKLDFKPDTPIAILIAQCAIMDSYLSILKYRADVEGFYFDFITEFNNHFIDK